MKVKEGLFMGILYICSRELYRQMFAVKRINVNRFRLGCECNRWCGKMKEKKWEITMEGAMVESLLYKFMQMVKIGKVEIYNEFSLQHELGIFLRNSLKNYKVQFERNTKFFGITGTTKHEIDIVIYNDTERYAIELKYPLNGQYPEQMFSFIKDICFMEELKEKGFDQTYCLTVVDDKNFYEGKRKDGIYAYFRGEKVLQEKICKPTGSKNEILILKNEYTINWCENGQYQKYYIVETK